MPQQGAYSGTAADSFMFKNPEQVRCIICETWRRRWLDFPGGNQEEMFHPGVLVWNPSKKIKGCGRLIEGCWRKLEKEQTVKIQASKKRGVKTSCRAAHGANAPNRAPD
jgi:hypothetical protein